MREGLDARILPAAQKARMPRGISRAPALVPHRRWQKARSANGTRASTRHQHDKRAVDRVDLLLQALQVDHEIIDRRRGQDRLPTFGFQRQLFAFKEVTIDRHR